MTDELKPLPCPFCGLPGQIHGDFNMEALSCSDRTGDCPGSWAALSCRTPPQRAEAIAAWNRRAQPAAPAAPAILMSAVFVKEGADDFAPQRLLPCGSAVYLVPPDAAPSVAPEPPTREVLAEIVRSHLTSTYHCTRVWEAWNVGTMTEDDFEPASESDMAEDIADAILAAHPPRAPLTEEQRRDLVKECGLDWQRGYMPLFEGDPTNRYAVLVEAVEAAHGIGGK